MNNATLILGEFTSRLQQVAGLDDNELTAITEAINITADTINHLKNVIKTKPFNSDDEEIDFFKNIKPQVDGKMIFYLMLLKLHHRIQAADPQTLKQFYLNQLDNLQPFYDSCYAFLFYCRMRHTYLDRQYFLRRTEQPPAIHNENQLFYDREHNAPMSSNLARIVAYDLFREHITDKLFALDTPADAKSTATPLSWTTRKAFLIELMYALQAYGVFNNTTVDIKKIALYFSKIFNVHFGNIYKTYEDIRLRKKNPTPFLDALRLSLIKKIDLDNENAM